ncbi:SRPBCC family protein [Salidesulfovibrio onnuriiensis]|uniref:SRPBCC family protein n=1 Tax=Salidesulfovibrio onnuriiensis TaxID=2583823 RepID=UPI0011CB754B|nr:SRPBCC family protein [Salidesulfovibrio onnuriiensis]
MQTNTVRRELTEEMIVQATPETVFPLLCPVREYDWLDQWECELVWADSGHAEDGCVFRTWYPGMGGKDTWMVSRFEPGQAIEFVRMNPSRAMRYCITLHPEGRATRLVWRQVHTSLDELGRSLVENLDKGAYAGQIKWLEANLNHYLETGECLRRETRA